VEFHKEIGGDNTAQQARIMGVLALIYGSFVASGVLIPNPMYGRLAIALCAAPLLGIGWGMVLYARRLDRRQLNSQES
jgi:hypothetical protein